jgi:hypothetical protein
LAYGRIGVIGAMDSELAALMAPYFDVDVVISDDRMYQVCGTKK